MSADSTTPQEPPVTIDGIWTMTETEFNASLRDAYDKGFSDCNAEYRKQSADPAHPIMRINPYEERKLNPSEVEEWRRTCPYPEALGDVAESVKAYTVDHELAHTQTTSPVCVWCKCGAKFDAFGDKGAMNKLKDHIMYELTRYRA